MEPKLFIAIVDDDPSVLKGLARLLRSHGCAVGPFASGHDFLKSLAAAKPDCLILDVQMPEMNGLELQARLAALRVALPVIFITAHKDEATRQLALRGGAAAYLHKPVSDEPLWAAISAACQNGAETAVRAG
ncbi:MAG: response regulator [Verrucomicrobia bacterium]|nr:response regulator [Verrucomicrobiota bacterium]